MKLASAPSDAFAAITLLYAGGPGLRAVGWPSPAAAAPPPGWRGTRAAWDVGGGLECRRHLIRAFVAKRLPPLTGQ